MARIRRIKKQGVANYHLMSRTNNQQFLFKRGKLKTSIVDAIRRSAEFSGVKVCAFAVMDNHFHIVARVITPDEPVTEAEVLHRYAALKGERAANQLAEHWEDLRKQGNSAAVECALENLRRRMNDISEFMKTFKESVNIIYKRENPHCGSIWSGRFKSTLIEDGRYLAVCIRYVELNPVRAGLVGRANQYEWSSANAAFAFIYRPSAGSVPVGEEMERRLRKRVAQVGCGAILGSREFVNKAIGEFGRAFQARAVARVVVGEAYATHGHKVAAKAA